MASLTNSTTILLSSSDEEDLTMEMFGTDITKLNIEDQSESSDANSSDEEHDEDKKTPAYIYNMNEKQRNNVKEINNSAGDWKINGMKFRNKTLELFLESIGLSFFLQSLLDANILSTQNFIDMGTDRTVQFLETIGATDNDIHKLTTVLFSNRIESNSNNDINVNNNNKKKEENDNSNNNNDNNNNIIIPDGIVKKSKKNSIIADYDKNECLIFLKKHIPPTLKLNYDEIEKNNVNGKDLLNALTSTRELIDVFGLNTCSKRVEFETLIRNNSDEISMPTSSFGTLYSTLYLKKIAPLYDLHMGCENMAPYLYSMVRFLKVQRILEVGAGYTSIFLLQALYDNKKEIDNYVELNRLGECKVSNQPYCVEDKLNKLQDVKSVLHCVDHMGHEHTTADRVLEIANDLGIDKHLQLHDIDFWDFDLQNNDNKIDFIWLDFAAGKKLSKVFERWWDRLKDGGFILCHSTLTNSMTRDWLEQMRRRENNKWIYETISFLEPHKYFQNSFSMFQKRENNYKEEILTRYP